MTKQGIKIAVNEKTKIMEGYKDSDLITVIYCNLWINLFTAQMLFMETFGKALPNALSTTNNNYRL